MRLNDSRFFIFVIIILLPVACSIISSLYLFFTASVMPSVHSSTRTARTSFISTLNRLSAEFCGPPPPGFPQVPKDLFQISMDLFKNTLLMTRTCSHITFLGMCLQKRLIPNGLRVNLQLNNSDPYVKQRINEMNHHTSCELIRVQLRSLGHNRVFIKSAISDLKNRLRCACSWLLFRRIIDNIRNLNNQIFLLLDAVKARKITYLIRQNNHQYSIGRQRVFTIPEDFPLNDDERDILSRGLSFAPSTKEPDKFQVLHESEVFFRSLRLRAHFASSTQSRPPDIFNTINPSPSSFTPATGTFGALDLYIDICRRQISELKLRSYHRNISPSDAATLRGLRGRSDIVIKPADKGGAVVVWRRDLYEAEGLRQLQDSRFYTPIAQDPTPEYQKTVVAVVTSAISNGELPPEAKRLIVDFPRASVFYMLPKIHKPNNPGRPIVSACSCPTEHISAFIDCILQPLVRTLPSFIQDTNHVLKLLSRVTLTSSERWLVTFDVTSLYTVIPHDSGISALRHFLDRRPDLDPPTEVILRLASLVLELTGFSFLGNFYKQTCGVAMGTKMGPSFANLFVGLAEEIFFSTFQGPIPRFYGRFIDDGLIIAECSETDLKRFLQSLGQLHPALELKFEISKISVPFLDLCISFSENRIVTSLFNKPTNVYNYLRFDSCHPKHTINSIPYSQFLRLRRICSKDEEYESQSDVLRSEFLSRGYPLDLISSARNKVALHQPHHHTPSRGHANNKLPAVFTYHPTIQAVTSILRDNFNLLRHDSDTTFAFSNCRLLFSYRRRANLRSILVRSSLNLPDLTTTGPGTFPCNRPRCKTCPFTSQDTVILSSSSSYTIRDSYTCTSENVIYCISCNRCPTVHYIGETQQKLAMRFTQHRFDIRHNKPTTGVSKHFNLPNHSLNDLFIRGIRSARGSVSSRRLLENRIIFNLGTDYPRGMNDKPRFIT